MISQEDLDNLTVEEYTSPSAITCDAGTKINELEDIMKSNGIRHLPVTKNNKVVGIISERLLLTFLNFDIEREILAEEIMTPDPYSVIKSSSLQDVVFTMSERKIGSALVVDNYDALYGIFTVTDALNALVEILRGEVPEKE